VPAELAEDLTNEIRAAALIAFTAAGGRDFARVDFMTDGESFTFLEINTLPGMTETSLLPKSASVFGYNFASLVSSMLTPALKRSKNF
jgi:D-alanine-D-alanine ligase